MRKIVNLNIRASQRIFRYAAEWVKDDTLDTFNSIDYKGGFDDDSYTVPQFKCDNALIEDNGKYILADDSYFDEHVTTDASSLLTEEYISDLAIYFPDYSVETYYNTHYYLLEAKTFINGTPLILYRGLIDRNDALGNKPMTHFENTYYESIKVSFADPYHIMYDDDWEYFRTNVTNYRESSNDYNDEGSLLYVSLTPLVKEGDYFTMSSEMSGSSNVIPMERYLDNALYYDVHEEMGRFISKIHFNDQYSALEDYLASTYWQDSYDQSHKTQQFSYYIMNEDGDYIELGSTDIYDWGNFKDIPDKVLLPNGTGWTDYREGFFFIGEMNFIDTIIDDIVLTVYSNKLPITKEIWAKCIDANKGNKLADNILEQINSDDMSINIVNQIKNEVVSIMRPESDDAKVVTPVFIRVQNASNINIHPNINEYITLNLDQYKSSVKTFIIRIGEHEFNENSRSAYGVTFKIIGSQLSEIDADGTYYILDQDRVLVTTGNYKYIV